MKDRDGGYTRILKMGFRQGDAADIVILEMVDYQLDGDKSSKVKKDTKAKKTESKKTDAKKAPAKKAAKKAEPKADAEPAKAAE